MKTRLFLFLMSALCLAAAATANAQNATSATPAATQAPIVLPTLPPSAANNPYLGPAIQILKQVMRQQDDRNRNNVSGSVAYFKHYDLQITTGRNAYRDIHLHQGTVINPRGWTLKQGDNVSVSGIGQPDGSLNASVITVQQ